MLLEEFRENSVENLQFEEMKDREAFKENFKRSVSVRQKKVYCKYGEVATKNTKTVK